MITDGRFSGGSHGFVVGHITPEAYVGGPIALVKNGDLITIDAETRAISLGISAKELEARRKACRARHQQVAGCGDGCARGFEAVKFVCDFAREI